MSSPWLDSGPGSAGGLATGAGADPDWESGWPEDGPGMDPDEGVLPGAASVGGTRGVAGGEAGAGLSLGNCTGSTSPTARDTAF